MTSISYGSLAATGANNPVSGLYSPQVTDIRMMTRERVGSFMYNSTGSLTDSVQSHHTPQALLLGLEGRSSSIPSRALTRMFRFRSGNN